MTKPWLVNQEVKVNLMQFTEPDGKVVNVKKENSEKYIRAY